MIAGFFVSVPGVGVILVIRVRWPGMVVAVCFAATVSCHTGGHQDGDGNQKKNTYEDFFCCFHGVDFLWSF